MQRSEETIRRNILKTAARNKARYAVDAEYRAKVRADALAWYYANRERVLERMRVRRRGTG
jgi:hypothetical protein